MLEEIFHSLTERPEDQSHGFYIGSSIKPWAALIPRMSQHQYLGRACKGKGWPLLPSSWCASVPESSRTWWKLSGCDIWSRELNFQSLSSPAGGGQRPKEPRWTYTATHKAVKWKGSFEKALQSALQQACSGEGRLSEDRAGRCSGWSGSQGAVTVPHSMRGSSGFRAAQQTSPSAS